MFKHIYLFVFIMGSFLFGQNDYEKWLKEQEAELIEMASKENEYLESVTAEFEGYVNQQEEYYKIFKDAVEKKWDSFRYSSNKTYVEYDENLNSRGSVDFEKGKIEIEVLVDDNPSKTNKVKDSEAISKLKGKLSQVITKDTFDKQILLKDQLKNKSGQYVNKNNISNFTQEKVKKQSLKIKKIKSKDGKKRLKYSLKVNMLPSHLDKRVERYKDEIFKQSERFGIDPAMVFAIIHTESSFNPKARSHIPAYGLMQLVPKSGGRDAYNYIYKKDKLLTGAYLYEPSNNIELGCAYIKKLKDVYFKNIIDDVSSDYCTISAYNTGLGNVAKAISSSIKLKPNMSIVNISGAMLLKPSVSIVNKKTSKELFQILLDRLPFQETKNYLKKVNSRVKFYRDANAKYYSKDANKNNLKPAPDFTLQTLDGSDEITFSDLKGKIVVLDFWATWCPPCLKGLPLLNAFDTENSSDFVKVFAVNVGEQGSKKEVFKKVNDLWHKNKYKTTVLLGSGTNLMKNFDVSYIPTTFVIDMNGNIYKRHTGFSQSMVEDLRKAVQGALESSK